MARYSTCTGGHESQDSQAVMECYQACYAAGEPSSSPQPWPVSAYPNGEKLDCQSGVVSACFISRSQQIQAHTGDFAHSADPHASPRPGSATILACPEAALPSPDSIAKLENEIFANNVRDTLLTKGGPHQFTMDSQCQSGTPCTQAILDAAMARALNMDPMDIDPDMVDTQSPGEEEQDHDHDHDQEHGPPTLQAGDTGAVNFAPDLIVESQPSSIPDDVQFTRGRGTWHAEADFPQQQQQQQQHHHHHQHSSSINNPRETPHRAGVAADPVTPALPRNPFLGKEPASVLAGSQLFQPSQMLSSAMRQLSPTSSRPSPDDAQNNSLSPNLPIDTSPIKRVPIGSSPTVSVLSSQLDFATSNAHQQGGPTTSQVVPASPPYPPRNARSTRGRDPAATYEPMHVSQQRRNNMETCLAVDDEDDHDDDVVFQRAQRRRRARLKRDEAAKGLAQFGSYLAQRQEARRPTKRRKKDMADEIDLVPQSSEEASGLGPRPATTTIPKTSSAEEVAKDSRHTRASCKAQRPLSISAVATPSTEVEEASVPGTSPTNSPQPPAATSRKHPRRQQPKTCKPQPRRSARRAVRSEPDSPDADELAGAGPKPATPPSSKDMASSPPVLRKETTKHVVGSAATAAQSPSSTSSLSDLSTPSASASTPPAVDKTKTGHDEPAANSPLQKESRGRPTVPKLAMKHLAVETRSSSRHHKRLPAAHDMMTDELAWSPVVFEQSVIAPKLRQPARSDSRQPGSLFGGMIFAVSFQNKKTGESDAKYNERSTLSEDVQSAIVRGGGKILAQGFHELFDTKSPPKLATETGLGADDDASPKLSASFADTGFTALIADGHTRKIKYMEALALGIPCIAHFWVGKCVSTGRIIDWRPYLLCTGESSMLGTVVSRSMASFSATDANLVDILGRREKLLDGHRVLVFARAAQDDKMRPYVFLVRALGASVVVARTADQARHTIAQQNSLNTPFDWIYVDEKTQPDRLLHTAATQAGTVAKGRKRKRAPMPAPPPPPPPAMSFGGGIPRTLTNELLIQSLIMGHIIDEDDWAGIV